MAFLKFMQSNEMGPIYVQEEYIVSVQPKTKNHLGVLTTTKGSCTIIETDKEIKEILRSRNSDFSELTTLLDALDNKQPFPVPVQTKPHPMEYIAEEGE